MYICALFFKMKSTFSIIFILISYINIYSQINEVGIFVGGTNYIGDVGKTNYISPNEPAFGLLYKWNKSPRHAWRISYKQGKIKGIDKDNTNDPSRNQRGYAISNDIKELSAGLEFNFFEFDLHDSFTQISPFVYTGVTYFSYKEMYIKNNEGVEYEKNRNFAIPMTVGVKGRITRSLVLAAEVSIQYTFTDNLDASNPEENQYNHLKFGNLNSNDWYVFSGLTLTYTFGENPCFCGY